MSQTLFPLAAFQVITIGRFWVIAEAKSVFDELVSLFMDAKKKRQVIIVTHNANLVINTDADQIIIADAGPHPAGGLGNAVGTLTHAQATARPRVVPAGERAGRGIAADPLLAGQPALAAAISTLLDAERADYLEKA